MTDTLRLTLTILILTVSLTAYFFVINAFFAKRVEKTQSAIQHLTIRSFALGLVNALFFGTIALILLTLVDGNANRVNGIVRGILLIPTFGVLGLLGILLSFGLTAMVKELGARLSPDQDSRKQMIWGSVVLSFACGLPFVGWFLLLPYVTFTGIGATILGFFQKS